MTTIAVRIDEEQLDRERHMRDTALGRVQVAADIRLRASEMLVSAIRAAHAGGASVEALAIESGLPEGVVRRIARGRGLGDLALFIEDAA